MKVKGPSEQTWRVTRRGVSWRRRFKGVLSSMPSGPGIGEDPVSVVIGVIFLILMIPFILLAIVAALELLLLLLVIPFALLARALFSQHWTVEARRGFHIWYDEPAGGWQASGIRIHALANQIRQGDVPARQQFRPWDMPMTPPDGGVWRGQGRRLRVRVRGSVPVWSRR